MKLECPYCEKAIDDPDDCYQDQTYEHECPHCFKNFVFTVSYIRCYDSKKAECLNGAPHKYEKTKTFPPEFARMECIVCGERMRDFVDKVE